MKTSELGTLGFTCLQDQFNDEELAGGYTSDLLSDAMAHLGEREVLITIQAHRNTIAVASLAGASAIVFCHGRTAAEDVVEAAAKEGIALFGTSDNQFDTTCRIAAALG
jgi:hypothetical protein